MKINATMIGGAVLAVAAFFVGSQYQKSIDTAVCDRRIMDVRKGAVDALNALNVELTTTKAERDQARSEVAKVNETTAAQYTALAAMLADDRVKREEASTRVEAAAKEAARNARTAGERAQAARDLISQIQDRCAGAPIPDDLIRMLDGIANPAKGAGVGAGAMPAAAGAGRP